MSGHQKNLIAKEGEAFHLLRLGSLDSSYQAFVELEQYAEEISNKKAQAITIARSMRFRAQIRQLEAFPAGNLQAKDLLVPPAANPDARCALTLRKAFEPYADWELVEQAEIHFLAALVASRLQFVAIQASQLACAKAAYQDVLDAHSRPISFIGRGGRALRKEATEGLRRCELPLDGPENLSWLGKLDSDHPHRPTA